MPAARFFLKGALEDTAFSQALRRRLGAFEANDLASAQIAVLVPAAAEHNTRDLAQWARQQGIPSITVQVLPHEIMIGPFAVPRRAGCPHCVLMRLRCAEAGAEPAGGACVDDTCIDEAAGFVARELCQYAAVSPMQSALLDHIVFLRPGEEGGARHRFLALPHCEVCGDDARCRPSEAMSLPEQDDPEAALAFLADCVDSRLGIVSQIVVEQPEDTGVDLPIVVTAIPPRIPVGDEFRMLPGGWGKGLTLTDALLSAVGETIERYSASLPDPARIRWSRIAELEGEILDPREFSLYGDECYLKEGFPYRRFDPSIQHPWVRGIWLDSGTPVWVPAILAFLSLDVREENLICQGTSNGLAASTNAEDAMLRATLELVERDAFMAAWFTARPGRLIEVDDTLDPRLAGIIHGLQNLGARIELYLLPTGVIGSAALCVAFGDGTGFPGATIGLGADLNPLCALRQAILELGQTGPYLRRMMASGLIKAPASAEGVFTMLDHAAYYFPGERAGAFNRVRTSESPLPVCQLAAANADRSLERLARGLKSADIRVALVDVTSRDLESSRFHIYRAISPDLQSITYGFGLDRLPVKRIRSLGLAPHIPEIHPIW